MYNLLLIAIFSFVAGTIGASQSISHSAFPPLSPRSPTIKPVNVHEKIEWYQNHSAILTQQNAQLAQQLNLALREKEQLSQQLLRLHIENHHLQQKIAELKTRNLSPNMAAQKSPEIPTPDSPGTPRRRLSQEDEKQIRDALAQSLNLNQPPRELSKK